MPIYEYRCSTCGEITSELRRMADRENPLKCPQCDGDAEVILSRFSTNKGNSAPASDSCAWSPGEGCPPS